MFDFGKVAAVGDEDLLFGLRALGIKVFSLRDPAEAGQLLAILERQKIALCLVHQDWLEVMSEEKKTAIQKPGPVLVGFADYRTVAETIERLVREMAVKATGSDVLLKRKGKDESA